MFKIGDVIFYSSIKDSIYQIVDTDPRFINSGTITNIVKNRYKIDYEVRNRNNEYKFIDTNKFRIISMEEYIKRCEDISYHLKCNAEMAEEIKNKFKRE